jgi:pimeloyl-ACP methyl ester carboxylesterase
MNRTGERPASTEGTTFALVHGAWAGSWCWEPLVPDLEARGDRVVAIDLPCDDATATFETYADIVLLALDTCETDDVVLVGHSLGGLTIPLVAARRPVQRLVYLCAFVPMPGRSFAEQLDAEPDTLLSEYLTGMSEVDDQGRTRWVDRDIARSVLWADCEEDEASAAFDRLRPQASTPFAAACPLKELPAVPSTYVVCSEDRIANPARGRKVARERLGTDLLDLPGSHCPFLSRPRQLAALLHELGASA